MVSVVACVLGGTPRRLEVNTVGDARKALELTTHTATVNGDPADDSFELSAEDYVSFAPAVKGG